MQVQQDNEAKQVETQVLIPPDYSLGRFSGAGKQLGHCSLVVANMSSSIVTEAVAMAYSHTLSHH